MVARASLALAVVGLAIAGAAGAQDLAASVPLEIRGQIDDMLTRSAMAPPPAPQASCGTVVAGQEKNWAAPAPWQRVFSHHPAEWPWLRQYPPGTSFRFCQYTARVTGTQPEIAYVAEAVTLNPTPAQLASWMASACRTAIALNKAPPDRFDQCVRALYWGLPLQAPENRKQWPGIRQASGGQFVVAGAVMQDINRGGVICYRDGVAVLRQRPGLPSIGYFVLTEARDGRVEKPVNDGELAECFKIASPKEWPGGSPAQVAATTRDQFWAALPKLGLSPSQFGVTMRADLEPSETWRRVVREAHLAALEAPNNVLIDARAIAQANELLR